MGCYSGGVEKVIFIKYVTIRKKLRILLHSMEEISFLQWCSVARYEWRREERGHKSGGPRNPRGLKKIPIGV